MRKISFLISIFILILTTLTLAAQINEPVVKNLAMDKNNKSISYELTQPAMVRIRVGSTSGPLHRTLVNWQKQNKGKHTIKWDGMDASGAFNILNNKDFTFSFNYYLPAKDEPINLKEYLESDSIFSDNFIGRAPKLLHRSQSHKNHKRGFCGDLTVIFELPNDIQKTKDGLFRVKGICPVIIKLPDKDKIWFKAERFSVNIFIDNVFVRGEALGYTPYTWNFNPKGINKGKHLITVNLKGFNDHIAVGSLPIYIEPAKSN